MTRAKLPPGVSVAPDTPDDIEQQFYEALQLGDVDRLMAVWSDDEDISCVVPGAPRAVGPALIRAAFAGLFGGAGPIDVRPERTRRLLSHACAVHSVLEQLRFATPEGPQAAWVIATNVYLKTPQGWRMVAHHASQGSPADLQEVSEGTAVLH